MSMPPPLETTSEQNAKTEAQATEKDSKIEGSSSEFKCKQCGAKLTYAPGTETLKCDYCDFQNDIPRTEADIHELDFHQYLKDAQEEAVTEERLVINCTSCGAESTSEANVTAQSCPFCDTDIVATGKSVKLLKPLSLLPFKIAKDTAKKSYTDWINGLWFAPNALKKKAKLNVPINGIYIPHWTYDTDTLSYYTGQRGTHYYVSETRTRTNSEGKQETYTTQVRKTRWRSTSGTVTDDFDDVLIVASKSLPEKYARELEPWDLENLVPYKDDYLSGFKAESYQVDLENGFEQAKGIMDGTIRETVRHHIGGDEQRILSLKTQHNNITFKHILLPVWLSAYKYNDAVYRFMVNARTGEVQGQRPWSWVKITFAVLGVIGLGVGGYFGYEYLQMAKS
jgi:Zn finger protein HypA/HybF involved in hydrogenase expression